VAVSSARLFAGLAGTAFVIAILGRVHVFPLSNLDLRIANISFGAFYWQLFVALVCAVFGFAYFEVRLMQTPFNYAVGLVGFFLVGFASVIWLISSFLITSDSPPTSRVVILLFAAIFSFISGVAVSAVNVAWVLLRK
jgi:hypothetical protein